MHFLYVGYMRMLFLITKKKKRKIEFFFLFYPANNLFFFPNSEGKESLHNCCPCRKAYFYVYVEKNLFPTLCRKDCFHVCVRKSVFMSVSKAYFHLSLNLYGSLDASSPHSHINQDTLIIAHIYFNNCII